MRLPLDQVRPGVTARLGGVRMSHVATLAELAGNWPPILVTRRDHRIIDGHYRFLAARRLQHREIDCLYFDQGSEAAFLEAVRRNTSHGLPLTVRERKQTAVLLLRTHPEWADRLLADVCCLAPSTIAVMRSAHTRPTPAYEKYLTGNLVDLDLDDARIAEALTGAPVM